MKTFFTFLLMTVLLAEINAQSYIFETTIENYTDLGNGGTSFNFVQYRDKINIGFNFTMDGFTSNKLHVYTSGNFSTDSVTFFSPFGAETSSGQYRYWLTGTAGNHILKMQFKHIAFDHAPFTSDFANFQVWLYEINNSIELRYGSSSITDPDDDYYFSGGPFIGHHGQYLKGDPLSPEEDTTFANLTGTIPNGTVYRFTPRRYTGIAQMEIENTVSIFPVPAHDEIYISNTKQKSSDVKIYDGQGCELFHLKNFVFDQALKTDLLPPGAYCLLIGGKSYRFVKE